MQQRAGIIDDIKAFEEFRQSILPALQKDIKAGLSNKQLREKYAAIAEARRITLIATSNNESAVNAAIKDLLDRTEGKPVEKKEIAHRLGKLTDAELDAMLLSETDED